MAGVSNILTKANRVVVAFFDVDAFGDHDLSTNCLSFKQSVSSKTMIPITRISASQHIPRPIKIIAQIETATVAKTIITLPSPWKPQVS